MTRPEWQELAERLAASCAEAGLDLTTAFDVGRYNLQALENERLFDFGRPNALGILVANTRALWPAFKRALAEDAALRADPNPLDRYVTTRLRTFASALGRPFQLVFAHDTSPLPFPIQRLAEAVEVAALSPSHLAIHPQHGPWVALRAVAIIDAEGPPPTLERLASPCLGCSAPCVQALQRALEVTEPPLSQRSIAEHAAAWIAVRDACPVGRSSRYGDEQLTYHYTKTPLSVVQS